MQRAVVGACQPPADGATAAIRPLNVDVEGADCGCRAVRRRLGRPHYSALHLRVALAYDALALVCARERERTARQPSRALHGAPPSPRRAGYVVAERYVLRPRYSARMTLAEDGKVK